MRIGTLVAQQPTTVLLIDGSTMFLPEMVSPNTTSLFPVYWARTCAHAQLMRVEVVMPSPFDFGTDITLSLVKAMRKGLWWWSDSVAGMSSGMADPSSKLRQ
jgi:hypothetical protein